MSDVCFIKIWLDIFVFEIVISYFMYVGIISIGRIMSDFLRNF